MPADLVIYIVVAVVLVVWLKNTLGTENEGDEPIASVRQPLPPVEDANQAVSNPFAEPESETPDDMIAAINDGKNSAYRVDGKAAENGVADILDVDPQFDLSFFFGAAQDVFVMVVEAFADGDRDALGGVLGDDVYAAFDDALAERESLNHRAVSEVIAVKEAHMIDAQLKGKTAYVTMRFLAEQTHAVYDADDKLVEGHAERAETIKDIWVFSRDLKSKDPRWLVVETRGDFEGDNDILPNA